MLLNRLYVLIFVEHATRKLHVAGVTANPTGSREPAVQSPNPISERHRRKEAVTELLASHERGHLFVAGCKTNQGKFCRQFDHIALLGAPANVLLARIRALLH